MIHGSKLSLQSEIPIFLTFHFELAQQLIIFHYLVCSSYYLRRLGHFLSLKNCCLFALAQKVTIVGKSYLDYQPHFLLSCYAFIDAYTDSRYLVSVVKLLVTECLLDDQQAIYHYLKVVVLGHFYAAKAANCWTKVPQERMILLLISSPYQLSLNLMHHELNKSQSRCSQSPTPNSILIDYQAQVRQLFLSFQLIDRWLALKS